MEDEIKYAEERRKAIEMSKVIQLALPDEYELKEILDVCDFAYSKESLSKIFMAGYVNKEIETLVLINRNWELVTIPLSFFTEKNGKIEPDFDKFSIIDYGHTIKLGEYEAASDAIWEYANNHDKQT